MLEKNPENRISLKNALEHPYFNISQENSNMCISEPSTLFNDFKDL